MNSVEYCVSSFGKNTKPPKPVLWLVRRWVNDERQQQLEQSNMTTRHLNRRELAALEHRPARTLERWRWLGEGSRFLKIDGHVVYRLDDIAA